MADWPKLRIPSNTINYARHSVAVIVSRLTGILAAKNVRGFAVPRKRPARG
jgi:hypothetical protein